MRIFRSLILAALAALPLVPMALAQNAGTSTSGGWVPRTALKPEPGKLVVPKGYKAEVFVAGLDTPSSAAVDREGNVWVAISGNRSEEHTSELQSLAYLVCRLLLEKKKHTRTT